MLQKERNSAQQSDPQPVTIASAINDISERNSIFFKRDTIYRHQLGRFNYTTYDVRRAQDVINPRTMHRCIMLLAQPESHLTSSSSNDINHQFLYAQVLGIYHANVIYTGPEMLDYEARRVEFLWVRWFSYEYAQTIHWDKLRLDRVRFPPMSSPQAFGFVDPNDVLRSCHIIPMFSKGRARIDRIGLSRCARDADDWSNYYVNRYTLFLFL